MQHWPALALLLLLLMGTARAQVPVRCFVQQYAMQPMAGGVDGVPAAGAGAYYSAQLDLLVASPLMLSFDTVSLSPVEQNNCPPNAPNDWLEFYWSNLTAYSAAFARYPTRCGDQAPLVFGMQTLATLWWGRAARSVSDNRAFRPQLGTVSMLTGLYAEGQSPSRTRPLQIRMASTRQFERALSVRTCMLATDVPPDVPGGAIEVTPPRLLPITTCVVDYGGHCSVDVGYINNSPAEIALRYPSAANRLVPASMENGFTMIATFAPGVHPPQAFEPRLHMVWQCDMGEPPDNADWQLDGLMLYMNAHDFICGEPPLVTSSGAVYSAMQVALETTLARHRDNNPYVLTRLQEQVVAPSVVQIAQEEAEFYWSQYGVVQPMMSTEAQARAADYAGPVSVEPWIWSAR